MRFKMLFIFLSFLVFFFFTLFSYMVAKETWQQTDFDTTVKLQDNISRKFDEFFSYFNYIGSAEVTIGAVLVLALLSFIRGRFLAVIGWLLMIPATAFEVFGKLVVYHPGPPVLFHRNVLEGSLPSFYVHTNFSYPSGHMTRTIFLITVFLILVIFSKRNFIFKLISVGALLTLAFFMALTRIYLGEHWLSDVMGGSLLGLASGLFASALIIRKNTVKII